MMHLLESAGLSPSARLASELFEMAWLRDFANSSRRWIWDGTGLLGGGLDISLWSWHVRDEPMTCNGDDTLTRPKTMQYWEPEMALTPYTGQNSCFVFPPQTGWPKRASKKTFKNIEFVKLPQIRDLSPLGPFSPQKICSSVLWKPWHQCLKQIWVEWWACWSCTH